jgi:hypothetical protein
MKAIMVTDGDGVYTIPGSAEIEDWDEVLESALARGARVERRGTLLGWHPWEEVYKIEVDGVETWYFVGSAESCLSRPRCSQ